MPLPPLLCYRCDKKDETWRSESADVMRGETTRRRDDENQSLEKDADSPRAAFSRQNDKRKGNHPRGKRITESGGAIKKLETKITSLGLEPNNSRTLRM